MVNLANSLWLRSQILEGEPTIAMLQNQYNSQLHSKYLSLCPQRNSILQKKETISESQNWLKRREQNVKLCKHWQTLLRKIQFNYWLNLHSFIQWFCMLIFQLWIIVYNSMFSMCTNCILNRKEIGFRLWAQPKVSHYICANILRHETVLTSNSSERDTQSVWSTRKDI